MSPAELKYMKEKETAKEAGAFCRLLPPVEQTEGKSTIASRFSAKTKLIGSVILVASLTLLVVGYNSVNYFLTYEQTDDAYTTGHLHQISSRINGTVERVLVDDNEHVVAGQPLVILDPKDFEVRVKQAQASLETAEHNAQAAQSAISLASISAGGKTTEAQGQIDSAKALLSQSQQAVGTARAAIKEAEAQYSAKAAEVVRAEADYKRFVMLANEGAVSLHDRDAAVRDYEVAKASREAAREAVRQTGSRLAEAEHAVNSARAQILQSGGLLQQAKASHVQTAVNESQFAVAQSATSEANAKLADAQLQLSYTRIVSPTNGRVGRKTVEAGQRVQPGQQLMTVVSDDVWLVANFKETQLEKLRPGESVEIKVDSFPHKKFEGVVDSIAPGSGATFALLPPDNATGNFTKIVQRVPVKVRFKRDSLQGFENLIVPGMSVVASVKVR
ncbi:MAG: HlyD family secretion protein [Candidatus Obscuribacterales bacterium]|nr:HlyD family secretion protein [Candidatus Obscuribacterales bacterium]